MPRIYQFSAIFVMDEARVEYQRLRHNILRRVKRIQAAGLSRFVLNVDLPDTRGLSDKDIQKYLRKAQKYEETVSVSRAKAKREAERDYRRIKKLDQDSRNFIHGVRKWLRRNSLDPNLITSKNYHDWIDYIEYRRAIESSSDKYMFEKYITDAEELLTDEDKQVDVKALLKDLRKFVEEQKEFVEKAKSALDAKKGEYSSDIIIDRFMKKRAKEKQAKGS